MPTDLTCKPCDGTGWANPDYPAAGSCDVCDGSGVAAWAVEAGSKIMFKKGWTCEYHEPDASCETCIDLHGRTATAVLAAVREEAKNQ